MKDKIQVLSFEELMCRSSTFKKLLKLTLDGYSAMKIELEYMKSTYKSKKLNCKILILRHNNKIVGWSFLTREKKSEYLIKYRNTNIPVFEVYIDPKYRRLGFGKKLLNKSKQLAGCKEIAVFGWDGSSFNFFKKFTGAKNLI